MASPRSIGSILITSAPQSARSAEAAGTKVCSATSRTRTPSITAVNGTLPLSARFGSDPGGRRTLKLTSTSTIASCRGGTAPSCPPGLMSGGATCRSTLPTAWPSATWRSAATTSARSNSAPMSGAARPSASSSSSSRSLRTMSAGWCDGEVAELEPEDVDALEQDQVQGDARDGAAGVAHGHEAAAVVQRSAGPARPGRRPTGSITTSAPPGQRLAQRLAQVAGAVVDQPLGATGLGRLRASPATRRPPSRWRPGRRRAAPRRSRRRRPRRAR